MERRVVIDLSPRLIVLIVLVLSIMFWAKPLLSIASFLLLGFILMSTVRPIVTWFVEKNVTKGWAVFLSYLFLFVVLFAIISIIIIPFVNQIDEFIKILPTWIENAFNYVRHFEINGHSLNISTKAFENSIEDLFKNTPTVDNFKTFTSFLGGFFGGFATFFSAVIFSIYLVLEHDSFLELLLVKFRSDEKRNRVKKLFIDMEEKLGGWVLGQGTISLISMVFAGVMLTLLKVPFAIPLAVFTGLMGIIPTLGTTLAGFIMALIALITVGPVEAIAVLVLYTLYQQVENNIITPKIMGNAVGLKPIIILLGVIILITLLGTVGGLIAVPLLVLLKIFYEFYIDLQKLKAKGIV